MQNYAPLFLFAMFLSGCRLEGGKAADMPASAPAPAVLKQCAADADCILMDISCNDCCDRDAVNRRDSARYLEHRLATCVGEPGAICKCCHFPARAACEGGFADHRLRQSGR